MVGRVPIPHALPTHHPLLLPSQLYSKSVNIYLNLNTYLFIFFKRFDYPETILNKNLFSLQYSVNR